MQGYFRKEQLTDKEPSSIGTRSQQLVCHHLNNRQASNWQTADKNDKLVIGKSSNGMNTIQMNRYNLNYRCCDNIVTVHQRCLFHDQSMLYSTFALGAANGFILYSHPTRGVLATFPSLSTMIRTRSVR